MSTPLMPGDRVVFLAPKSGLKLRGVVAQTLNLKAKGEDLLVPIQRPRATSKASCLADHNGEARELKTRWLERSKVRKLPD